MNVVMYEPPEAQRVGGLELAIRMLEDGLRERGLGVTLNPSHAELAALSPEIVHFHGLWQRNYPRIGAWCRERGTPYVVSPHGMLEPWAFKHKWWKKWPYYAAAERPFLRRAACVLATSAEEARNLRPLVGGAPTEVIRLAIRTQAAPDYAAARQALGWPEGQRVLVFLSRIHEKKGLHLLIDALEQLEGASPERLRLAIVGDGETAYVEAMRARAERLRPRCTVEWVGPVWSEKKWRYLQGADLFCLPTFSENFGLVVLESCLVGTPVLTTRETPWTMLEAWGAGLITMPRVQDVREALGAYLGGFTWSDADRRRLAARSRAFFDPAAVTEEYIHLYRKCAETSKVVI